MKKYNVPIVYQSIMEIEVEAGNMEDAIIQALKQFLAIPDENYVCDSFEIDPIFYEENEEESQTIDIDWVKIYESI
jgi:hypothetical protein